LGLPPPNALTACVIGNLDCIAADATHPLHRTYLTWQRPNAGKPIAYVVFRSKGNSVTPASPPVVIAGQFSGNTFIDTEELPTNTQFTYFVKAVFDATHQSNPSNFRTITAIDDAPSTRSASLQLNEDTPQNIDVLSNVSDDDSPASMRRLAIVSVLPAGIGTATLNADKTITFTPADDEESGPTATITYSVDNGLWTDGTPLNAAPANGTLTVTILSRHTSTHISMAPVTPTYGDLVTFMAAVLPDVPAVGAPAGKVQFSIDGGPGVAVNIGDTFTPLSLLEEGSHTITAKYCNGITSSACAAPRGDGLFYGSADSLTFTVKPRPITATADAKTKVYGDADPPLTYTITTGSLVGTDAFTGALVRASGENAGSYDIKQGTLALSHNYALTFVGASLSITPRPASVTPNVASKTYGGADPLLTGTMTGFLASDNVLAAFTRAAGESVGGGPYVISATLNPAGVLTNYTITYNTASFTIAKANAAVVVTPYNSTYTGLAQTAAYTIAGVNGESGAAVGTVDASHTAHTDAGSYVADYWTFTAAAGVNGVANYNDIGPTVVADAIAKANATVTVTGYNVTFDGAPHTATYVIAGVNGQSGATVGSVDVSGTTHSATGTYNDSWTFTGTSNYNSIGATAVVDVINAPPGGGSGGGGGGGGGSGSGCSPCEF
ncbi:MAG TPA: MBG domain-containing protein, partial [Vicinamibacterales bacterium]|nr:MBG domain-containing protein [Vicinamibacterales bacterium]